ncbi:hypothetical protein SASPL_110795 [Salvia splendens]|uniref:CCT domain-containing protein n=2 Tax=Salvia splendens TaxID=180675 RepID=A0A8X8Y599_SALSN|nr:uncharacterized protein LOC121798324 isoform X1 [Salvia splendens]KAG6426570.1 hypothetical protein SASPL_110795 [Salvia splendens]
MYAETGLMFPYFSQEAQQFDDFGCSQRPNSSLGITSSLMQTSTISDYNLGGEGDLFKAPEPVIGEPLMAVDPMTAAISMISCGEDVISPQSLTVSDIESSIESGKLISEVFYECRKDLLAQQGNGTPLCDALSIKIPSLQIDENIVVDEKLFAEGALQKSLSSSCLRPVDGVHEAPLRPRFLDFPVLDFGAFNGMRRAFSEGDIKTLDNDVKTSLEQSSVVQPRVISSCRSEDRKEKLSRYWNKKSKRNFGRKIKYACRKALADSQPRIRGRFAKTEEMESPKMQ